MEKLDRGEVQYLKGICQPKLEKRRQMTESGCLHLQETLADMVETQLATMNVVRDTSYYKITEEGETTLSYFTNEISDTTKEEILEYLKKHGAEVRCRTSVQADYYKNTTREFSVR